MLAVVVAEGAAILLLGMLVAGLLRSHAEILRGLHSLGVDLDPATLTSASDAGRQSVTAPVVIGESEKAYDVIGHRSDGSAVAVGVVGAEQDTVLVFLSTTCSTCRAFWDSLADDPAVGEGTRVAVVVEDGDHRGRLPDLPEVDVVLSTAAWRDYQVPGAPHVVHIDGPTGRVIGQGTGASWEQVRDLLLHAGQSAGGDSRRSTWLAARDNAARIDAELARAGIGPGHASLYPPAGEG